LLSLIKTYFCLWILVFLYFDKIILYAVILRLGGENSRCLLFIVIPVSSVCTVCLLLYDMSSIIGRIGLVGIFLASRVTYILAFVRLRCVECRAGTSIFGRSAGVGGGTVRIFCRLGSILVCVV
jgi:hypothetical protein